MLGGKDYTQEEFDNGKVAVEQEVAAYANLGKAIAGATADKNVTAAREQFDARFFKGMVPRPGTLLRPSSPTVHGQGRESNGSPIKAS